VLREQARSHPLQPAVADAQLVFTYPEFDARVDQLAAGFATAGVKQGDRIVWLGQNSYRTLESMLAAARLGAIFCPVNWRQSAAESVFVLDDLEPSVVIWQDAEIGSVAHDARERSRGARRALWLQHDAHDGYEAFLEAQPHGSAAADLDLGLDDPVLAVYTAAFGGRPNAALLSNGALIIQNLVIGRTHDVTDKSVNLNSGPLFHVATLMLTLATLHHGGLNVFTARADATAMCELIERYRVTHAFIPPPTAEAIREANADGRFDLSSMWATPDLSDHHTTMVTPRGTPWDTRPGGYGQTEAVGLSTFCGLGSKSIGSAGRTSPGVQLRIVDTDGKDVAPGDVGEFVMRGPTVMNSYYNRPAENAERSTDGWHHSNDLGRRETDGSVTFIGPRTTMIKSAAENIYPAEVEAALRTHPAVADVCVIGIPDGQWVQSVRAVVVLKDGETVTDIDLIEHCRSLIASYKKPKSVVFADSMPRTAAGALDRAAVDAAYEGGGYPGTAR
jgi:long-chain acyl-CoA synthetase